uniref:Leucine rich repeat containing 43 n=1 Tax=Mastacembelus armatus TaxID=205130 RepID=A0A7N8YR11_9TELE
MSSNTLSAVLEKQIRRLCLNDFPCGNGSWVSFSAFGSQRKSKDSAEGPGTEETDALLDLLSCPHSPWGHEESWSPQAAALRQLAVLTPERLHADFIYKYFTTFHIVDKDVSIIDDGLLKFSKLEELVLTANKISEIPVKNLPNTLKILELRANRLSALSSLTNHPPPRLQYLGLGFNSLGSHDIAHLTGRHWPHLVCLDLSDCEFQDQPALLNSLSTLPCLKTLMLQGNPFTLVSSFPGFTVDSLPQLCFLDALLISSEERRRFRGLAEMSDLIANRASVTVSVGTMRGIPNPLMSVDQNAPGFPVVTYSYFITYKFLVMYISHLCLWCLPQCPIKSGSTKDKKKKSVPELVQDAPIKRILGSVHVPLQSLLRGSQKVDTLCDFGALKLFSLYLTSCLLCSADRGKQEHKADVHKDNSVCIHPDPVTVELSVELEKWRSVSEAHQVS